MQQENTAWELEKGGGEESGDKYLNNYKPKEEKLELKAYSTFQS